MKYNTLKFIILAMSILLSMLFVKFIVSLDIPLWLKFWLLG